MASTATRRVKVEHGRSGENPRFVVTTLHGSPPEMIYDVAYCSRGQAENFIKDLENAMAAEGGEYRGGRRIPAREARASPLASP